jgi:hypothetical protein
MQKPFDLVAYLNQPILIAGGYATLSQAMTAASKLKLVRGTYKIVRDGKYFDIVEVK